MLQLKNLVLRRGPQVLLDDASVTIHAGEKLGLVGRNGAGKSSLLALFDGSLQEDAGDFALPADWRMAQVAQHMPESDEAAVEFVLAGDIHLGELQRRLAETERSGDGMAMAQLHSDLHDAGAHDARARAEALILGLGFQVSELNRPVNSFSGGWRMRLQLARALMAPSDLLLLDEPTNHLDLDALVWLEGWLSRYPGTLIVISHDREFLDAITTVTLHIDRGQLTRYTGNYSAFEDLRAAQLALQQTAFSRQQGQIAHLQKFIDRFRAKASKARQAQSRIKALERMERVAPVLSEAEFQFQFKQPNNLPNPMLAIRDGVFGYPTRSTVDEQNPAEATPPGTLKPSAPDNHQQPRHTLAAGGSEQTIILSGVSRTVMAGQRIGILGANGQGKSTLVKTIARTLPLLAGQLIEGKGLLIGYFAQHELDVLHADGTPLEHMVRLARETGRDNTDEGREQALRNFLGSFSFPGDMLTRPVGQFSGGEKARLVLAMIVWQRPNLLLLDEPTNHLDLVTREALAMALTSFEGTLMLVSHDRALLRTVCDDFWLVSDGTARDFDGDLEDYQRHLLDVARRRRESMATPPGASSSPSTGAAAPALNPAEQRRQQARLRQQLAEKTRPHRRALDNAEQRMAAIAREREALEQQLTMPLEPEEIADAGRRLKALQGELEQLEEQWLEHSSAIETLESEVL